MIDQIQHVTIGRPLNRFIYSLGIETVGEGTSKKLAKHFKTFDAIKAASESQLMDVPDIGPITAQAIRAAFNDEHFGAEITALYTLAKPMREMSETVGGGPLAGWTIVITGTLPNMGRTEAAAYVEKLGGKISGAVSRSTSAILAGENAGSKLKKAESLGIPIYDEAWLASMI